MVSQKKIIAKKWRKGSDIEQCQWLYTPNGHKITLDSGDDYFNETKEAIQGYLENVAIKSASKGIRHFEVGNELERFPHPSVLEYIIGKKLIGIICDS